MIPKLRAERDGTRFLTDPGLEVLAGIAGTSEAVTSVHDYVHYFRDRYNRLGGIVRARAHAMPIEALVKTTRYKQQECTIIGMVGDSRTSTKGHKIVQVEDPTGTIAVLFNKNRPDFSEAERLIPDEVIGVRGTLSPEGTLFFGNQLIRPDIPMNHAPFLSKTPGRAVLISDVHVGSNTFLPEAWDRFAAWLKTADVWYLLIAGDVVDGIGVYPGQEQELVIQNIYEQYNAFGEMLAELPKSLKIVVSPGNHDVVRGAEPQPALPDKFTGSFPENCTVVENPALISLQGVRVLMYHGRSIDDMISLIPGATYENPGQMMEEMLQRRHLAPSYGRQDTDRRVQTGPAGDQSDPRNPADRSCSYHGDHPVPRGARDQCRHLAGADRIPEADEYQPDPGPSRRGGSSDARARSARLQAESEPLPWRYSPPLGLRRHDLHLIEIDTDLVNQDRESLDSLGREPLRGEGPHILVQPRLHRGCRTRELQARRACSSRRTGRRPRSRRRGSRGGERTSRRPPRRGRAGC